MIYLDNAATSKIRQEVLNVLIDSLTNDWPNASTLYQSGLTVREKVEQARQKVADILKVKSSEIIFTSSASESNATAINYFDKCYCSKYNHKDIKLNDKSILIDEDFIYENQGDNDIFAWPVAESETGMILDLTDKIKIVHDKGAKVLLDATQAIGKSFIYPYELGADYVSFGLHKINGPRVGVLFVKEGAPFKTLIYGAQEDGRRGSTENSAYIIAGAVALDLAYKEISDKILHGAILKSVAKAKLESSGIEYRINEGLNNLTTTFNFSLKNIESEIMQAMLSDKGICIGIGSACNDGSMSVSDALSTMGVEEEFIRGPIRLSFSLENTKEEVEYAMDEIIDIYKSLL